MSCILLESKALGDFSSEVDREFIEDLSSFTNSGRFYGRAGELFVTRCLALLNALPRANRECLTAGIESADQEKSLLWLVKALHPESVSPVAAARNAERLLHGAIAGNLIERTLLGLQPNIHEAIVETLEGGPFASEALDTACCIMLANPELICTGLFRLWQIPVDRQLELMIQAEAVPLTREGVARLYFTACNVVEHRQPILGFAGDTEALAVRLTLGSLVYEDRCTVGYAQQILGDALAEAAQPTA